MVPVRVVGVQICYLHIVFYIHKNLLLDKQFVAFCKYHYWRKYVFSLNTQNQLTSANHRHGRCLPLWYPHWLLSPFKKLCHYYSIQSTSFILIWTRVILYWAMIIKLSRQLSFVFILKQQKWVPFVASHVTSRRIAVAFQADLLSSVHRVLWLLLYSDERVPGKKLIKLYTFVHRRLLPLKHLLGLFIKDFELHWKLR